MSIPVGARRHRVLFQAPGAPVPNGDGGYTHSWTDIGTAIYCEVKPATQRDLERATAGTVLSTATSVITGPFMELVNTSSRAIFDGRTFSVIGKSTPAERKIEMILLCVEVVA
jgi:SPP1 family predicted phage head-tail adaptor